MARRFDSELRSLLIGAVGNLQTPWSATRLYPSLTAGHSIYMLPQGADEPLTFHSVPADGRSGMMTTELAAAIDTVLAGHVHVSEWRGRFAGDMPGVDIGFAPTVSVKDDVDAMTILRAVGALPTRARLLPPGG